MVSKNQLKIIRSLKDAKYRRKYGLFVAEGQKIIAELIEEGVKCEGIYLTESSNTEFLDTPAAFNVEKIDDGLMKKISNHTTPPNILALFEIPEISDEIKVDMSGRIVMFNDIRDPGNLGTIVRTCDWFGINSIICSKESVDSYNPKVVQSSMGSIARVNVHYLNLEKIIHQLKNYGYTIMAADLHGSDYNTINYPDKCAFLFGSESHGLNDDLKKLVSQSITIPRIGKTESLNLGISLGIVLSKVTYR